MPQIVKLNSSDLNNLIRECVERVLNEGYNGLCSKLTAIQNKLGDIAQINLPERASIKDIKNEDIVRITKNPNPDEKYTIKLSNGYYVIVSPESEAIVNANKEENEWAELKRQREAEIDAEPVSQAKQIPYQTPEEHKEELRAKREAERGPVFRSMKQVQDYIEEKYGEHLEFLTTRTRRGRDYVYQARITYLASSYADGPSHVDDEVVKDVTKYLEPFGFYYAGNREDHDERQWSTNGWHVWKRHGASDPYERHMMRQARDEMEFGY